jgi:hypothetical protein
MILSIFVIGGLYVVSLPPDDEYSQVPEFMKSLDPEVLAGSKK